VAQDRRDRGAPRASRVASRRLRPWRPPSRATSSTTTSSRTIAAASLKARPAWTARQDGLAGVVRDQLDEEHAARQADTARPS
jgi:hypothetical protein